MSKFDQEFRPFYRFSLFSIKFIKITTLQENSILIGDSLPCSVNCSSKSDYDIIIV